MSGGGSSISKKKDPEIIRESLEEEKVPEANPRRNNKKYKNLNFHQAPLKNNSHENLFFNNKLV